MINWNFIQYGWDPMIKSSNKKIENAKNLYAAKLGEILILDSKCIATLL